VAFRLVYRPLWLKANDSSVKLCHNLELAVAHPHLRKHDARSTLDEHLPLEGRLWGSMIFRQGSGESSFIFFLMELLSG
jgi:hypothetical protein